MARKSATRPLAVTRLFTPASNAHIVLDSAHEIHAVDAPSARARRAVFDADQVDEQVRRQLAARGVSCRRQVREAHRLADRGMDVAVAVAGRGDAERRAVDRAGEPVADVQPR